MNPLIPIVEQGPASLRRVDTVTNEFSITCPPRFSGDGAEEGSFLTYIITKSET